MSPLQQAGETLCNQRIDCGITSRKLRPHKQACGVMRTPDTQAVLGVQNYLDMALQKLKPVGNPSFSISSRTDSGVHALCNSAHVDIETPLGKPPFSESMLVKALNYHLREEPISVMKAVCVNSDFHARYKALSRTYVYRLVTGYQWSDLPVFERNLCWAACRSSLDVAKMQEAAQILIGTHDFSAFRSINSETPFKSPIKTLVQADVTASTCLLPHHLQSSDLQFLNFTFKANSFVYKQVRRMTSALVSVGLGLLTQQQIRFYLETGKQLVCSRRLVAPPDGLFLKEVEYSEADLRTAEYSGEELLDVCKRAPKPPNQETGSNHYTEQPR